MSHLLDTISSSTGSHGRLNTCSKRFLKEKSLAVEINNVVMDTNTDKEGHIFKYLVLPEQYVLN